jgi:hypothetical protein
MLLWLTKNSRNMAALVIAALYTLCILASSAALAFAHGDELVDCLMQDDHSAVHQPGGTTHVHTATMVHHHLVGTAPHQPPTSNHHKGGGSACCTTLFTMAALLAAPGFAFGDLNLHAASFPVPQEHRDGREPDRINRPPIG